MIKKLLIILLGIIALSLASVIGFTLAKEVEAGNTILANYTLRRADGTVYYTSLGHKPMRETLGTGKLIPGFEEALMGMHLGQSKTLTIPSEKAYGQHNPDLVGTVSRDMLAEDVQPVVGEQLWAELKDGTPTLALVKEFTESTVTLDANHPLAGLDLIFDIQLLGIDDHQPLGSLTNLTFLTWAFLALGAIIIGLAIFYFIKRRGFQWMTARGLQAILAIRRSQMGMRLRRDPWILLLAFGTLFLGIALVVTLNAEEAEVGDTVSVNYTLKLDDGTVYYATTEGEPLQFRLGEGKLIVGIEESLIGMREGESKTVKIPPEKAYGPYHPELVVETDRSMFPEGSQLVVGQPVRTTQEDGTQLSMVVTEFTETTVTLDGNHTLAGKNLTFDIELAGISKKQSTLNRLNLTAITLALLALALFAFVFAFFYLRGRRMSHQMMT